MFHLVCTLGTHQKANRGINSTNKSRRMWSILSRSLPPPAPRRRRRLVKQPPIPKRTACLRPNRRRRTVQIMSTKADPLVTVSTTSMATRRRPRHHQNSSMKPHNRALYLRHATFPSPLCQRMQTNRDRHPRFPTLASLPRPHLCQPSLMRQPVQLLIHLLIPLPPRRCRCSLLPRMLRTPRQALPRRTQMSDMPAKLEVQRLTNLPLTLAPSPPSLFAVRCQLGYQQP